MTRKAIVKMPEGKISFYSFELKDHSKLVLSVLFVTSILGNATACAKILMKSWRGTGYFY